MKIPFFINLTLLFFICQTAFAQKQDSLLLLYKQAKNDTAKLNYLSAIGEKTYSRNPDSALIVFNNCLSYSLKSLEKTNNSAVVTRVLKKQYAYSLQNISNIKLLNGFPDSTIILNRSSIKILKTIQDDLGIGNGYANIGLVYYNTGLIDSSIIYCNQALVLYKKIKVQVKIAEMLNNLALFSDYKGDIPKALNSYLEALTILQKLNDENGLSYVYNNIGGIYYVQHEYDKALDYHEKALKLKEKNNDQLGVSETYLLIGRICNQKKEYVKALDYYHKSLEIREKLNNLNGVAEVFGNMSHVYKSLNDTKKTIQYLEKAIAIQEKINDKNGLSHNYKNLGRYYLDNKDYTNAIKYSNKAMNLAYELGFPENILFSAKQLYSIYNKTNNYKLALQYYQLYMKMNDSITNIETQKSIYKQQTNYEYQQKKALADLEFNAQIKSQKEKALAEKNKQLVIIICVSIVLVILALFSFFMFKRFKLTQKQKNIIELKEQETERQNIIITQQKNIVEEKHREITDSINYAERIQHSFLATKELLDENLKNYFVYFKPKDVVSGDFYWGSTVVNANGESNFALVTADSTGHGVPGAIMSLLNITSLENAVKETANAAEILNLTRQTIINRLKKDGSAQGGKDGMDCSIVIFDRINNKLFIAAANNPVWIIREGKLIEIKPDKMPVGKHDKDTELFTQHSIDVQKGDLIYTMTDGFADQFGGEKGKKFMSKNLKELLISNTHLAMNIQKEVLDNVFTEWKKNVEQVDDVCIIGVKV